MYKFYSEFFKDLPLPPEYSFAQAFNYLNPETNSFYILERNEQEYIQCAGSKASCTVEVRLPADNGAHVRYTVGHRTGQEDLVHIPMSDGGVFVHAREVLSRREAIGLFTAFFAGEPLAPEYSLRPCDVVLVKRFLGWRLAVAACLPPVSNTLMAATTAGGGISTYAPT